MANLVADNVGDDLSRHPSLGPRPRWSEVGDARVFVSIKIENPDVRDPAALTRVGDGVVESGNDRTCSVVHVVKPVAIDGVGTGVFGRHIDVERSVIFSHQRPRVNDCLTLSGVEVPRVAVVIEWRKNSAVGNIGSANIAR